MHISRRALGVVTAALFAILAVAGCGGSSDKPVTSATSASPAVPIPTTSTLTPPPTEPTDDGITNDPLVPNPAYDAPAESDFSRLDGNVPAASKRLLAPSEGTPIIAVSYAISAFKSYRDFWATYFASDQFDMPRMNLDLVSLGDVSTTPCHNGDISTSYPAMVYCARTQHILIPMNVLASQWGGSRKIGDLAAAIAVSRNAGNSLVVSLAPQLNVKAPAPEAQLYVSACFSGVWAHSVYPQNTFTDKELQTALDRSVKLRFELDGAKASASSDALINAWGMGFRGGRPADCATNFWTLTS